MKLFYHSKVRSPFPLRHATCLLTFYVMQSVISVGKWLGDGPAARYSGNDAAAFFDSFEFIKSQVQIMSCDSQLLCPLWPRRTGVLVVVTGRYIVMGRPPKAFCQVFSWPRGQEENLGFRWTSMARNDDTTY